MISARGVMRMAVVAAMVLLAAGPALAEDWSPLWTTATLSQARTELAATSADGKVFFGGGFAPDSSTVVDIFDAATLTRTTASLSQATGDPSATSAGGKVFFAGGWTGPGESAVVDIFDAATLTRTTTSLSQTHYLDAATSAGGKVFFAGGWIGGSASNVVDIYDTTSGTWSTAQLSQERCWLAATSAGNRAFFGGGYNGVSGVSNVVDIFDAATLARTTTSLSQERCWFAAASAGNRVFFGGGYNGVSGVSNVVDIYDTATGTWSTDTLSQAPINLGATSYGNRVFFGGGETISGLSAVVDIYTLQNYGTITSTKDWTLVDNTSVAGRMQLNGGSLNLDGYDLVVGSMAGVAPISLGVHTLTAGGDDTTSTYSGRLSGHGDLTKAGAGTLTLSGTSPDFDGTTRVSGGALNVTGSIAASSVHIEGGTLQGTGRVGAITGTSGHLHPGGSPGILQSGSLTMSPGFGFDVSLDGPAAGSGYSQLDVTGAVNLGGATLGATLGYAPAWYSGGGPPDLLTIIKNDGTDAVTGQFDGLAQMSEFDLLYNGTAYRATISYEGDYDLGTLIGGNDVVVELPEPATLSLLAAGLAAVWMRKRRVTS